MSSSSASSSASSTIPGGDTELTHHQHQPAAGQRAHSSGEDDARGSHAAIARQASPDDPPSSGDEADDSGRVALLSSNERRAIENDYWFAVAVHREQLAAKNPAHSSHAAAGDDVDIDFEHHAAPRVPYMEDESHNRQGYFQQPSEHHGSYPASHQPYLRHFDDGFERSAAEDHAVDGNRNYRNAPFYESGGEQHPSYTPRGIYYEQRGNQAAAAAAPPRSDDRVLRAQHADLYAPPARPRQRFFAPADGYMDDYDDDSEEDAQTQPRSAQSTLPYPQRQQQLWLRRNDVPEADIVDLQPGFQRHLDQDVANLRALSRNMTGTTSRELRGRAHLPPPFNGVPRPSKKVERASALDGSSELEQIIPKDKVSEVTKILRPVHDVAIAILETTLHAQRCLSSNPPSPTTLSRDDLVDIMRTVCVAAGSLVTLCDVRFTQAKLLHRAANPEHQALVQAEFKRYIAADSSTNQADYRMDSIEQRALSSAAHTALATNLASSGRGGRSGALAHAVQRSTNARRPSARASFSSSSSSYNYGNRTYAGSSNSSNNYTSNSASNDGSNHAASRSSAAYQQPGNAAPAAANTHGQAPSYPARRGGPRSRGNGRGANNNNFNRHAAGSRTTPSAF